jgi:transposase-like protein
MGYNPPYKTGGKMTGVRKRYNAQEKAKIVLDILKGEMTQSQLMAKYGVHSSQMYNWKKRALEAIAAGFSEKQERRSRDQSELIEELYKQIGQLKVELDWLKKKSELFG